MKHFKFAKEIYFDLFPIFLPYSTLLGFMTGIYSIPSTGTNQPFNFFSNTIGYTGIGIITGIAFPITYPLFAGYIVYKNVSSNIK